MPAANRRACTAIGEGTWRTPRMIRARYRGHRSRSAISSVATPSAGSGSSSTWVSGFESGVPVAAETSRAIPSTERKSGRFGVTSMSRTASSSPNAFTTSAPGSRSFGSTRMPSCDAEIPSSSGAQSMPFETTPRISRAPSGSGSVTTVAPGGASGTRSPGAMFRTPTTTSSSPDPVCTRARHRVSLFGWSRTSITRATTTPETRSHGRSIASTSAPLLVSSSASSSADRSVGHSSRNQDRTTFTPRPRTARGTGRRPRRTAACRSRRT